MANTSIADKSTPKKHNGVTPVAKLASFSMRPETLLINRKLEQLNTLLMCSYGIGRDWFEEIGQDNRDSLVWLASDLAGDIYRAFETLQSQQAEAEVAIRAGGDHHHG
ncbi:MAG: hypothetical protein DI563_02480 [Variovorax paradoxus]|uniref:Uncharacterized protein n=1 Tax=Variovorax paradoxus TaxID=34073 RepID=A0A2W5QKI2_VARPD|nr:MAG: hypothetical protein DI563_02480 [Variovorax paradoxus]